MSTSKPLTYLEQKQRCREIHKWLKISKSLHLARDPKCDIDVPVENDVKMELD